MHSCYQTPVFTYVTACLILLLLWLLLINTFPFTKSLSLDYPITPKSCLITDSLLQAVPVSSASLSNWASKFFAFLVQALPEMELSVFCPCSHPLSPFSPPQQWANSDSPAGCGSHPVTGGPHAVGDTNIHRSCHCSQDVNLLMCAKAAPGRGVER